MRSCTSVKVKLTIATFSLSHSSFAGAWPNRDPLGESGFTTLFKHKGFKKAHLARRMAELSQGPNIYCFVGNSAPDRVDRFGLDYSPEDCATILNQIDFLFSLKGRTGMNDNSLQQQINDLQDEYDENCGDDDEPPNPTPQPDPVPSCPTQKPQPTFCQSHPTLCNVGIGIGIGLGVGVGIGIIISTGGAAAPVLAPILAF
jgi:hypothetical protein